MPYRYCILFCCDIYLFYEDSNFLCGFLQDRSQWPRGLRRRSAAARLLGFWVRIPPGARTFCLLECCVLSGRGLCDELITRPEEAIPNQLWLSLKTCITGYISYMLLIVTVKPDCWMSSDRLKCSGLKKESFLQCLVKFSTLWSRHSFQQSLAKRLPLALTATTERVPWSNISVSSIRKTSSDQLWSLLHLISGICLKEEKKNSANIHFASSLTYSKRLELRMLIGCTNIPAHWISLSALYSLFTNPKVGLGPVLARLIFSAHLESTERSDGPFTMVSVCFVDCVWNVVAHAQKLDFVFRRNGLVHLNRQGRQFSRMLAAEVCASAVVMLNTPFSELVWRAVATHSIRQFPLHFPSRASPCAITFQLDSNKRDAVV